MPGWLHPREHIWLSRRIYLLLLTTGLVSLLWLVVGDAEALPAAGGAIQVTATAGQRALTGGSEMDGFGAWSADSDRIAFMRSGQIWLINSRGDGARALTRGGTAWDAIPAWRPGSGEIAYVRLNTAEGSARIMLVNPADGKERQLFLEHEPIGHIAWEPSGRMLYYTTARRLMRLNPSTGKAVQVLSVPQEWELLAGGLAIHPNGKSAVFGGGPREARGVRYDLWHVQLADGAEPQRLTKTGGIMPAFGPKGLQLVYRNPRQSTGIFLMQLKGHSTQRIVPDAAGQMHFHPAISPDGQTLLLSRLLLDARPEGGRTGARFTSHLRLHRLSGSGGD